MRTARVRLPGRAEVLQLPVSTNGQAVVLGREIINVAAGDWLPPVTGAVYGVILNDRGSLDAYGERMNRPPHAKPPVAPTLYIKPANTFAGHRAIVTLPRGAAAVEVGATLAVVFAHSCTRASAANALAHVAGYAVAIDFSLPKADLYRPPIVEKCWDGSCPIGPWLVAPAAIPDPGALTIETRINGALRHTRSTSDLLRPLPTLIADITEFMSFHPGDALLIGYPLTVPTAGPGDAIAVEIAGVGRLECRLASASGDAA